MARPAKRPTGKATKSAPAKRRVTPTGYEFVRPQGGRKLHLRRKNAMAASAACGQFLQGGEVVRSMGSSPAVPCEVCYRRATLRNAEDRERAKLAKRDEKRRAKEAARAQPAIPSNGAPNGVPAPAHPGEPTIPRPV